MMQTAAAIQKPTACPARVKRSSFWDSATGIWGDFSQGSGGREAHSREIRLAGAGAARLLDTVRGLFTWLLMFGVIAGLCGRVLALDHSHGHGDDASECCGHLHHDSPEEDPGPTPDCPPSTQEHHTHACCYPAPLTSADVQLRGLVPPGGSRVGVAWSAVRPPDEPVFALDKPPLI